MSITLNVGGMSCGHCENAIKTALLKVDGVQNVAVSLKNKTVHVTCDENISQKLLQDTIEEQGFDIL